MPITFEIDYLRSLKKDSKSCVYVEHAKEHLALHPFQLDNTSNSIKELLNTNIAKYCKHLNGILLGYDNIKLLERDGFICDDSCYVHTDIEADFYVFRPEIDRTLLGIINKISKDHVACLVHKTFTISLPKPDDVVSWIGSKASVGQEVQFTIVDAIFEGSLPYIRGNIVSLDNIDDSGFSTNEDQHINEEYQFKVPKEKKSIRKRKLTEPMEDQEESVHTSKKRRKEKNVSLEVEQPEIEIPSKKVKRRKNKVAEGLLNNDLSAIKNDLNEVYDKKTKKRKRNASIVVPLQEETPLLDVSKRKKRKRSLESDGNLEEIETSEIDVHNTDKSLSKRRTKKHNLQTIENTINEGNHPKKHKKKDKIKSINEDQDSSDNTSKIKKCTNTYEDLLKRLTLEIGDNSLITELKELLVEKSKKSKKEKKRKKARERSELCESMEFDLNTLFSAESSNISTKTKKNKGNVKIISDIRIVPDL